MAAMFFDLSDWVNVNWALEKRKEDKFWGEDYWFTFGRTLFVHACNDSDTEI